jgi:hypothetical protein
MDPALIVLYLVQPHNVLTFITIMPWRSRKKKKRPSSVSAHSDASSAASSGSIEAIDKTRLWILKRVSQHHIKITKSLPRKPTVSIPWFGKGRASSRYGEAYFTNTKAYHDELQALQDAVQDLCDTVRPYRTQGEPNTTIAEARPH